MWSSNPGNGLQTNGSNSSSGIRHIANIFRFSWLESILQGNQANRFISIRSKLSRIDKIEVRSQKSVVRKTKNRCNRSLISAVIIFSMKKCYKCGEPYTELNRVSFQAVCPKCQAYLHCCFNCRVYDPYASNRCKSSTTEWVPDRQKYNYCDEFEFAEAITKKKSCKEDVKTKFDKLFKK